MDKSFKYWLSWIGVLPISLIAGLLVTFPVHWVLYRTLMSNSLFYLSKYPKQPEMILQPFFSSLVIIWVASRIAPQYKFKTAFILTSIWVFGAGSLFVLVLMDVFYFDTSLNGLPAILGGLPAIMGVGGAVLGLYIVKKNKSE
jgi:hypothetical protein